MTSEHRILPSGDSSVNVEFEERIDPTVNARVIVLAGAIEAQRFEGIRDIVPAYRSVTVHFDPVRTDVNRLFEFLARESPRPAPRVPVEQAPVRIPVCYGGQFGPDLGIVAELAGVSEDEVVARHLAVRYRVFMLGFVPGFAYLGSVDPRIAVARRATPRVSVPQGAVGLAGEQTGIYPIETPGGWQLIGRTPVRPFDLSRSEPFLLQPGDMVEFYRIETGEYAHAVRTAREAA
jgi:inhibitor of KinA